MLILYLMVGVAAADKVIQYVLADKTKGYNYDMVIVIPSSSLVYVSSESLQ